jgi:hypothetical protein
MLSGVMVAMSFTALVIPLAMYHVAQVAAAVGRQQSALMLLAVIGCLLALGLLSGEQLFVVSALIAALWSPAFLLGIVQREKGQGRSGLLASAVAMSFLPLLGLLTILLPPQIADFPTFLSGFRDTLVSQSGLPSSDPALASLLQTFDQLQSSQQIGEVAAVLGSSWQGRLLWMIYGTGAPWLFGLVMIALGNLLLLDMAFDQVERMRAVVRYVDGRQQAFGQQLVRSFRSIRASLGSGDDARFEVTESKSLEAAETKAFWQKFVRPLSQVGALVVLGRWFRLRPLGDKGWQLREFSFPLLPGLLSALGLLALGLSQNGLSPKGIPLPGVESDSVSALLALVCFLGSALLALQGIVVAIQRLTPLGLLCLLLIFVLSGGFVVSNPLMVIALFGSLGLLDQLYDLRGHRQPEMVKRN